MAYLKRDQHTKDLFAFAEDNRPSLVYMATNTVNGKRYIGITRNTLPHRRKQHCVSARCATANFCKAFYAAIRKYGEDAFEWSVLANCDSFQAAATEEIRLIALLTPEYNMSPGGDGVAGIGQRASAATRKRLRESHLGKPGFWTGKKRSPESIAKRTATRALNPVRPWLGKRRDSATMEKIAVQLRKWVICLDDGKTYHGLRAAAAAYGIPNHKEIARVCVGRAKSIYGHRFAYTNGGTQ